MKRENKKKRNAKECALLHQSSFSSSGCNCQTSSCNLSYRQLPDNWAGERTEKWIERQTEVDGPTGGQAEKRKMTSSETDGRSDRQRKHQTDSVAG